MPPNLYQWLANVLDFAQFDIRIADMGFAVGLLLCTSYMIAVSYIKAMKTDQSPQDLVFWAATVNLEYLASETWSNSDLKNAITQIGSLLVLAAVLALTAMWYVHLSLFAWQIVGVSGIFTKGSPSPASPIKSSSDFCIDSSKTRMEQFLGVTSDGPLKLKRTVTSSGRNAASQKYRASLVNSIREESGQANFWRCVPKEHHPIPLTDPRDTGIIFLSAVLIGVLLTQKKLWTKCKTPAASVDTTVESPARA